MPLEPALQLRLIICLDSDVLVKWVNGHAEIDNVAYLGPVSSVQDDLAELQKTGLVCPWTSVCPLVRHVERTDNMMADLWLTRLWMMAMVAFGGILWPLSGEMQRLLSCSILMAHLVEILAVELVELSSLSWWKVSG